MTEKPRPEIIAARLDLLARAVAHGRFDEFTMRVSATGWRTADFVLHEAARMVRDLAAARAEVEALRDEQMQELRAWAVSRWHAEVAHRPLQNVHRRTLDGTWRQVIRFAGGDPDELVGPSHDTLRATAPNDPETQG